MIKTRIDPSNNKKLLKKLIKTRIDPSNNKKLPKN